MPAEFTDSPRAATRRRARPVVLLGLAIALVTGILAVPGAGPLRAAQSGAGWTTDLVPSARTVAQGSSISFDLEVLAETSRTGLIDLEINDSAGRRVFQQYWDREHFTAQQPRHFTSTWAVPADARPGEYVVRVGVFVAGWGVLFHWMHIGTTFEVTAATPSTTTPPPTTSPATTVPATSTTVVAPTTAPPRTTPTTTSPPATTAPPVTTPPTTTTTSPPPTTAPAVTTPPTAPATTVPPPPTTAPERGTQFSASFDTAADFYDRFDVGLSGFHPTVDPNYIREWQGDHDLACGLPTTQRTVHLGENRDDIDELFWWCAPAGSETGHLMTSLDNLGYNILWFSPKPWFTNVSRVCWDQNTSFMGGRKWTQVTISSRPDVERVQHETGRLDLGFSHPGFQLIGGPTTEIIPTDATVGFNYFIGLMTLWQGDHDIGQVGDVWKNEDVAKRYTLCAIDNGNNTITMTQERPNEQVLSATYPGSFPKGQVRVAFHDANYNPSKDGEYESSQNTWHWDNIEIS